MLVIDRDGLGPKTLRSNKFYKGHRDIAENPHITLEWPQFHYLKSFAILEKASISLKISFKSLVIFTKASNF
jgi:hypothetical protein